jgi:hypothetical protein
MKATYPLSKKCDARTRHALAQTSARQSVDLLVRLEDKPTKADLKALQAVGCDVSAEIGNVVAATILAKRLPELAELDFVRHIEFPRTLMPESSRRKDAAGDDRQ